MDDEPGGGRAPQDNGRGGRIDGRRLDALVPRIPLLMPMLPNETFGSWLRRCAVSHRHKSVADFALSILSLEGLSLPSHDIDWDCDPPPALLEILCRRGRLPLAQLQEAVVSGTQEVLRPRERDAYCPICFQSDLERHAIHRRRDWLNSWTMTCAVHGCLLWSYEHVAFARATREQSRTLVAEEQIRLGMERVGHVTGFSPPYACWSPLRDISRRDRDLKLSEGRWLDRALLTSEAGRSLLLLCGSRKADSIYYVLFGVARPEDLCWTDELNDGPIAQPARSPRANIRARLTSAYTAAAIWQLLDGPRRESGVAFTTIDQIPSLAELAKRTDRWPQL